MADNAITSENASTADTIDPEFAKMFVSATQGGKPSSGVNAQQSDDSIDPEFSSLFNKYIFIYLALTGNRIFEKVSNQYHIFYLF